MRELDYEAAAAQWLRRLRGRRSQVAFSRRLGYRSNVAYLWESGRNWPTAAKALHAASRTGIDVAERLERFFRDPPAWLREQDPTAAESVAQLLDELRGSTPIVELASRVGCSRFAASRWLKAESEPRLPDFFRMIEAASLRLLDFIALFVDPKKMPSVAKAWTQLNLARRLGSEQPWAPAVFLAMQLEDYLRLPCHQPGWLAQRLGLTQELENECIALLQQAGHVRHDEGGRLRAVRVQTVDTRPNPEVARRLRQWSATVGLERLADNPQSGVFAYNVFAVSQADFEELQQLQRRYYRSLRAIVASSEPAQRVVATNLQLFALDAPTT